jgi:hypothetical protein
MKNGYRSAGRGADDVEPFDHPDLGSHESVRVRGQRHGTSRPVERHVRRPDIHKGCVEDQARNRDRISNMVALEKHGRRGTRGRRRDSGLHAESRERRDPWCGAEGAVGTGSANASRHASLSKLWSSAHKNATPVRRWASSTNALSGPCPIWRRRLAILQHILGHRDLTTTMRYARVTVPSTAHRMGSRRRCGRGSAGRARWNDLRRRSVLENRRPIAHLHRGPRSGRRDRLRGNPRC